MHCFPHLTSYLSFDTATSSPGPIRKGRDKMAAKFKMAGGNGPCEVWPKTIELIDIECGLLSHVIQKSVSTKWRISKGN